MAAILTQGTTISIDNTGGTPVVIGGHMTIDFGGAAANLVDVTTLLSTSKEYVTGLKDEGSITIAFSQFDYDDIGQIQLQDMIDIQETRECIITTNVTTLNVLTFNVRGLSMSSSIERDGAITGTFEGQITGSIVRT